MAGGSNEYRAALVRHQLMPGLISSLPEMAGLPQFISFSTSYLEDGLCRATVLCLVLAAAGRLFRGCLGAPPAPE